MGFLQRLLRAVKPNPRDELLLLLLLLLLIILLLLLLLLRSLVIRGFDLWRIT